MVEQNTDALDTVFHALADPTRRAMVRRLTSGQHTISELAAPFRMSLAGAAKHVRVLEAAGLVQRQRTGRAHRCYLNPAPLAAADAWLRFYETFWMERFAALDALVTADDRAVSPASTTEGPAT